MVLQPKPVFVVHVKALEPLEHDGIVKSAGVVEVAAPITVFWVCVALVNVTAPTEDELLIKKLSPLTEDTPAAGHDELQT